MLDINLTNGVTDPEVTQLITDYVNERSKLPKCNCGNLARPCGGLRACLQTNAPPTEGGVYTKLDRAMSMFNILNESVTESEHDQIIANFEDVSDSMNTKIEEMNSYINANQSNPNIQDVVNDRDILEQFLTELSSYMES